MLGRGLGISGDGHDREERGVVWKKLGIYEDQKKKRKTVRQLQMEGDDE